VSRISAGADFSTVLKIQQNNDSVKPPFACRLPPAACPFQPR